MKAYKITLEDYLAIVKLAKQHGKKTGDSMQEEFDEYHKNKKLNYVGDYQDIDMLKGNLREEGFYKIVDLTKKEKEDDK